MQAELTLGPIGQIARAVDNLERAQAWFKDVLGLPHLLEASHLHTDSVLYFRVADIHRAHGELDGRGVQFTDAPHMIAKHPDGTEEWMAFFRDSEGYRSYSHTRSPVSSPSGPVV